ncbi:hypothetical protein GPK29_25075, partial [Aeromonas hydrophila]|uniref:hypothetical protein n=1 Tax=Aeromonas hydrophila TaxID=644 RepID=UPI001C5AF854
TWAMRSRVPAGEARRCTGSPQGAARVRRLAEFTPLAGGHLGDEIPGACWRGKALHRQPAGRGQGAAV